jgi:serine/threonine protein kinase
LNGFKGLHEVRAMHRDFKIENVLLHNKSCKIADLGFGKQLNENEMTRTKLGSNFTMAPEVMRMEAYDFKADIWSIGVVFYQLLFGDYPFKGRGASAILEKAIENEIDFSFSNINVTAEA